MSIVFLQLFLLVSALLLARENIQRFCRRYRMNRQYSWLYIISNTGLNIDFVLLAICPTIMNRFPAFENYILSILVITWGPFWTGSLQAEIFRQRLDFMYRGVPLAEKYQKDRIVRNLAILLTLAVNVCFWIIYVNL